MFMNVEGPKEFDPALRATLRDWKIKEPLPPRFEEQVWQRIARRERQLSTGWFLVFIRRMGEVLVRPAPAASYLSVLLAIGLLAGYRQARIANVHAAEELSARYVQMLDPYQMPNR